MAAIDGGMVIPYIYDICYLFTLPSGMLESRTDRKIVVDSNIQGRTFCIVYLPSLS
jgi:hypothetical protein